MSRREEICAVLLKTPALPIVAQEIFQLCRTPDTDLNDIVKRIEYDPGFTANLLRLANSSHFAGRAQISSVRHAVARLGTRNVSSLIMVATIAPIVSGPILGYRLERGDLLRHAVGVAVISEELARMLRLTPPPHLFTSGLLHDIGKVVFSSFLSQEEQAVAQIAYEQECPYHIAEQQVLGIDHAEAGALLLDTWGLPPEIGQVVRWHHQPYDSPHADVLLDLVHAADTLAMAGGIGIGSDGMHYCPSLGSAERLKLHPALVESVLNAALEKVEEMCDSMVGVAANEG